MKTVLRNSYSPKIGDYCETIVVDKETENAYIFDCDGVFTPMPQPVDVEEILEKAAEYTDETVAPLKEKLDTIEEGAQVNVIEQVMKNGTPLTITNKSVNVTVPTKTSDLTNDGSDGNDTYVESATLSDYYTKNQTDTQIGYETTARELADQGLQTQIDAIVASSDVVDIVGTYAALQAYDTSKLHDNDIIKVLADETRDEATTYYRWDKDTSTWSYIGAEGPFYTKAESDATFVPQTRTVNNKALSADITLTASDVGALPDSTVIPTVNDATLTIQKNGVDVQTFTANQSSNATANISVPTDTSDLTNGAGFITSAALPTKTSELQNDGADGTDTYAEMDDLPTKTSDLQNDGADGTSTYVEVDDLATIATTGDYDDLLNKPTIPTVNDGTLTIQKNGTNIDTFTANQSGNTTVNVTVPTATSDLNNDSGFIDNTTSSLTNYYTKTDTYTQQEVNGLINSITVPTKTSDLVNDGADNTSTYVEADELATVATTGDYDDLLNKPAIPTYSDFTGATSGTAGAHGLVPAPAAGDEGKFLQGDGTWATVSSGQTYTAGNGINIDGNNEISVDTTVVATKTDLTSKQDTLTAGNAITIDAYDEISVDVDSALSLSSTKPVENSVVTAALNGKAADTDFTGATSSVAGAHGLVPAPAAGDQEKVLHGDGTWKDATAKLVEMSYGEANAWAKFIAAYNAGSIVYCRASSNADPGSGSQTRKAFMAYVNNATNPTSVEFQYVRSASSKTDSQQCDQVFVYTLKNTSGGTWSVATRDMATKINVDSTLNKTYSSGANASMTLGAKAMTGATSGADGAAGIVPKPVTGDQDKYLKGDGTWGTPTDTTYSDFTGATSGTAGAHGLVPAPAAGDEDKYLKGDGTWATVSGASSITNFFISDWLDTFAVGDTITVYADEALTTPVSKTDFFNAVSSSAVRLIYDNSAYYVTFLYDNVSGWDDNDEPSYEARQGGYVYNLLWGASALTMESISGGKDVTLIISDLSPQQNWPNAYSDLMSSDPQAGQQYDYMLNGQFNGQGNGFFAFLDENGNHYLTIDELTNYFQGGYNIHIANGLNMYGGSSAPMYGADICGMMLNYSGSNNQYMLLSFQSDNSSTVLGLIKAQCMLRVSMDYGLYTGSLS